MESELTYKVRGADGKEYGPVSLNQLMAWFSEGRVARDSAVKRSDVDYWVPASQYMELEVTPEAVPPAYVEEPPVILPSKKSVAVSQQKSGAAWFFWIAALTLVNTVVAHTGGHWQFSIGLAITEVFDGARQNGGWIGNISTVLGLVLDVWAICVCVAVGLFAYRRHVWAFIVGMILYAMDATLLLLAQSWIGVLLHGIALYFLFRGLAACRELKPR